MIEKNPNQDDTTQDTTFPHIELSKIKEKRDFYANQYLDRVTDFIKYTTPLSLAAILWIGSSITSFKGLSIILIVISLVLLFLSIYISITIFFASIRYSSMNLATYQTLNDFLCGSWDAIKNKMGWNEEQKAQIKQLQPFIDKKFENKNELSNFIEILDQLNQSQSITEARIWDIFVRLHLYSLFLGFLLYIIAIFLNQEPNILINLQFLQNCSNITK